MPKIIFTDDTIAKEIFELRTQNKPTNEIANILNLTYSQVVYLIKKYNLPKKYFWLSELEKNFIKNNAHLGNPVLAKILNRNITVISRYTTHTFFTESEKKFIKENINLSTAQLARQLGRSYNQTNKIKRKIQQSFN
jgi:DNA-binding CsgD family transcriptional regulator